MAKNISVTHGSEYYRADDQWIQNSKYRLTRPVLTWSGHISRQLGIEGTKAMPKAFKLALKGNIFGSDISSRGGVKERRRAGFDTLFAAPKSFSIQALVNDDLAIIPIFEKAVSAGLEILESRIGARYGSGGKRFELTGQGLYGRVTHILNRSGEPHLHDHCVFINVTKDESGYRSMSSEAIYLAQGLAKQVFYQELVSGSREAGYEIWYDKYEVPQLEGISQKAIRSFSQRTSDLEDYLKEHFGVTRSEASIAQKDTAWQRTRADKVPMKDQLVDNWKTLSEELGSGAKAIRDPQHEVRTKYYGEYGDIQAEKSLQFAVSKLAETKLVFNQYQILAAGLQQSDNRVTLKAMSKQLDRAKNFEIRKGKDERYPTLIVDKTVLQKEKKAVELVLENQGIGFVPKKKEELTRQQRQFLVSLGLPETAYEVWSRMQDKTISSVGESKKDNSQKAREFHAKLAQKKHNQAKKHREPTPV
jgi:conjugative relaxase-like TrwC/TraI family protein